MLPLLREATSGTHRQRLEHQRFAHVEFGSGEPASQDVWHLLLVEDGAQRDHVRIRRGPPIDRHQGQCCVSKPQPVQPRVSPDVFLWDVRDRASSLESWIGREKGILRVRRGTRHASARESSRGPLSECRALPGESDATRRKAPRRVPTDSSATA